MYCGNCGKTIEDDAAVCPFCGAETGNEQPGDSQGGEPEKKEERGSSQIAGIGISIALFAALIYWSGLLPGVPVVLVLLAGYALVTEKDQWLRAVSLKAICTVVCFGVLLGLITLLTYFKDVMVDIVNMLLTTVSQNAGALQVTGDFFGDLLNILKYVIMFIRDLFLLLSGFRALKYRNVRIPVIDNLVNRHIRRPSGRKTNE